MQVHEMNRDLLIYLKIERKRRGHDLEARRQRAVISMILRRPRAVNARNEAFWRRFAIRTVM
jgi:hypothetical protein